MYAVINNMELLKWQKKLKTCQSNEVEIDLDKYMALIEKLDENRKM